jgi:hypothetical protein
LNDTELQPYLIEITGQILKKMIPTPKMDKQVPLAWAALCVDMSKNKLER